MIKVIYTKNSFSIGFSEDQNIQLKVKIQTAGIPKYLYLLRDRTRKV